jgi:hypothetical protein
MNNYNVSTPKGNPPNFCTSCGKAVPKLTPKQQLTHRYCSACMTPIQWEPGSFIPVTIDEATGTIIPAEDRPLQQQRRNSFSEILRSLASHPGKVLALGAGAIAVGGGLVIAAAPLVALSAAVAAGGVAVIKTAALGGVISAIVAAKINDAQASSTLVKGIATVAVAGVATLALGGLLGLLAAFLPVVGWVIAGVGAAACAALGGHQLYLHQKRIEPERRTALTPKGSAAPGPLPNNNDAEIQRMLAELLTRPHSEANGSEVPKNRGIN